MLRDDQVPTPEQRIQMLFGRGLATECATAALIASHPEPERFAKLLQDFGQVAPRAFATVPGLQKDDGMRDAFSEQMRLYYKLAVEG